MSVELFDTAVDEAASNGFLAWRREHGRDGFYLNENHEYGWVLHRADCGHAVMPAGSNMASNIKVCATATAPLRAWVENRGEGQPHKCQTCRPPVPPLALSRD